MQAALVAAQCGHEVTLWEEAEELGGQFRWAAAVPGKEDYALAIASWEARLAKEGVQVRRGHAASATDVADADHVILATGVRPRALDLPGFPAAERAAEQGDVAGTNSAVGEEPAAIQEGVDAAGPVVLSYAQWFALRRAGQAPQAQRVAVIGAGGIGVDVSVALTAPSDPPLAADAGAWRTHWGVGDPAEHRGGVQPVPSAAERQVPEVHLLQRRTSRIGAGLGRTTGWVHRAELRRAGVIEHVGVEYLGVDAAGLHFREGGKEETLAVDLVLVCAGQESQTQLLQELQATRPADSITVVGGARLAGELDAERAIREGHEAALAIR